MPTTTNNNDFYDSLNTRPREVAKAFGVTLIILAGYCAVYLAMCGVLIGLTGIASWYWSL